MQNTVKTTIENLASNYVSAIRRANTAAATAGQQGAWLIACHMADGQTIDEAFDNVKSYLREKGEGPNAIEKSRPLVPFACSIRNGEADLTAGDDREDENSFPKNAKWPTLSLAKAVSTLTNRTASSTASFEADMEEARETAKRDLQISYLDKGIEGDPTSESIDKRVVSLAAAKKRTTPTEGGNGDKVMELLRDSQELGKKLSSLTDKELKEIEKTISEILDSRHAVS
tara:strand:+ start:135 stop:821 length:687 start_codon:yes stop_codon:yes gene_type:complete